MQRSRVKTALHFAQQPEAWVKKHFSKPFYQIWQELHGAYIFELVTGEHATYHTIQKVKTFTPPSSSRVVLPINPPAVTHKVATTQPGKVHNSI